MAQDKRIFTGGLDKDTDSRLLQNGDYYNALNFRNITSADGTVGVLENVIGNAKVSNSNLLGGEEGQTQKTFISFVGYEINGQAETFDFKVKVTSTSALSDSQTVAWTGNAANTNCITALNALSTPVSVGDDDFNILVPTDSSGGVFSSGTTGIVIEGPIGVPFSVILDPLNGVLNKIALRVYVIQEAEEAVVSDYFCIGALEDSTTDSIIYFLHDRSKNGFDCIMEYNQRLDSISTIYQDGRGGDDVLKFSANNLITGIDKIDDILYWTDDKERPRKINVKLAKANEENIINAVTYTDNNFVAGDGTKLIGMVGGSFVDGDSLWINQNTPYFYEAINGYCEAQGAQVGAELEINIPWLGSSPFASGIVLYANPTDAYPPIISFGTYDEKIKFLDAIKHQPKNRPSSAFHNDPSHKKNDIIGEMWQFRYRYRHIDDEYSKYSPISDIAISEAYAANSTLSAYDLLLSIDNTLKIKYNDTIGDVTDIEIIARKGNHGEFFRIDTVDNNFIAYMKRRKNSLISGLFDVDDSLINFKNNGLYPAVGATELDNNNDNLPKKAKAQIIISNNRMAYGNILDGYDNTKIDVALTPSYSEVLESVEVVIPHVINSFDEGSYNSKSTKIDTWDFSGLTLSTTQSNTFTFHKDWRYKIDLMGLDFGNTYRDGEYTFSYTASQFENDIDVIGNAIALTFVGVNVIQNDDATDGNKVPHEASWNSTTKMLEFKVWSGDNHWSGFEGTWVQQVVLQHNKGKAYHIASDFGHSTFKSGAFHDFGIIYSDETNRVSYVNSSSDSKVYASFPSERSTELLGPTSIGWSINHTPPLWATSYQWAYSGNTSVDEFIQMTLNNVAINIDEGDDSRIFLGLGSLKGEDYSYNEILSSLLDYTYAEGDRIRLISYDDAGTRKNFKEYYDFEITGYELYADADETSPVASTDGGSTFGGFYISINDPKVTNGIDDNDNDADLTKAGIFSGGNYTNSSGYNELIAELYRPKKDVDRESLVYNEIGDKMDIISAGTESRRHQGSDGDQLGSNPATGTFSNGDIYIKPRLMRHNTSGSPEIFFPEDYYLNDFYNTNHYDKGRLNIVNEFSKERRLDSTVMYSGTYSSMGTINNLNTFNLSESNFMDYNKGYGPIQSLKVRDDDMIIFQENKVSRVLVGKSIITTADGGESIALSKDILSTQSAYAGDYGCSLNPEGIAKYGHVFYFCDIKRGSILRLAPDGLTVISNYGLRDYVRDRGDLYIEINPEAGKLGANYRIRGGFDPAYGEYVLNVPSVLDSSNISFWDLTPDDWETITTNWEDAALTILQTAETLGFNEKVNRWVSFYSYHPEFMSKINRQFVSFYEGNLYKHDESGYRCNFYGIQYGTDLGITFNKDESSVKNFKALGLEGDTPMDITLSSELNSTSMKSADFEEREGIQYANIPFGDSATSSGGEVIGIGFCDGTISNSTFSVNFSDNRLLNLNVPTSLLLDNNKAMVGGSYVIYSQSPDFDYNTITADTLTGTYGEKGNEFLCNATTADTTASNDIIPKQYLLCIDDGGVEKTVGYISNMSATILQCVNHDSATQTTAFTNKFTYIKRVDTKAEGDPIKGQYLNADLTLASTPNKITLFAVDAQIAKSELSNK